MSIHKTAIIEDGAILADDVKVGPYTIIGPNVVIQRHYYWKPYSY